MKRILDRVKHIAESKTIQTVLMAIMGLIICVLCIPQFIRISVSNSTSCYTAYSESKEVYNRITLIVNDETERPVNDEQLTVWRELKRATNDYGCPIFPHEHDTKAIKRKLPAFAERKPVKKPQATPTVEDLQIVEAVESRVTVQRVRNILSHGDISADRKNIGLLVKAMQADIISEIECEQPNLDIDKATQYARKHTRFIVKTIKEAL